MSVFEWTTPMPVQTMSATWSYMYVPVRYEWDDTAGHHEVEVWQLRRVA